MREKNEKMNRERQVLSAIVAASLALASCGSRNNEVVLPTILPTPAANTPLNTPTIVFESSFTPTPTPEPTPTAGFITNPRTGAIYQLIQNPDGSRCAVLGKYSISSLQDVVGAATVLGPDPYAYSDHFRFKVTNPDGSPIGTFTTDSMPSDIIFGNVLPKTVVCED